MVYEIDGKFYVLASNKYREVEISKVSGNEYDVKLVDNVAPIEKTEKIKANSISVKEAYERRNAKNRNIERNID